MASRWSLGSVLWLERDQPGEGACSSQNKSASHLRKYVTWPFPKPEISHQRDPQGGSVWDRDMGASI